MKEVEGEDKHEKKKEGNSLYFSVFTQCTELILYYKVYVKEKEMK